MEVCDSEIVARKSNDRTHFIECIELHITRKKTFILLLEKKKRKKREIYYMHRLYEILIAYIDRIVLRIRGIIFELILN